MELDLIEVGAISILYAATRCTPSCIGLHLTVKHEHPWGQHSIPVPLPFFSFTDSKASFAGGLHFYDMPISAWTPLDPSPIVSGTDVI